MSGSFIANPRSPRGRGLGRGGVRPTEIRATPHPGLLPLWEKEPECSHPLLINFSSPSSVIPFLASIQAPAALKDQ